ncbi:DEAD/DEAH box helicase family protein [Corynebacterium callunae]|uniref:DEAD/DEAH box helicase family protein n=1 Tax=Corynebacterium callunae TaxID=1721 RepID=UPI003982C4AB
MLIDRWANPEIALQNSVDESFRKCIEVYRNDFDRIEEDFKKEASIAEGGYGRKQIQELVQNAADALQDEKGRIEVRLTEDTLYVANQGTPISQEGVRGLLYAHLSSKHGDEIGRFGLGFKSVGSISDNTKVYSQTVSFEFDRKRTNQVLREELGYDRPDSEVPGLRLSWVIDPLVDFEEDPILKEFSKWAVTIIKVPLFQGAAASLFEDMKNFDESFCLFTPRVKELALRSDFESLQRVFKAQRTGKTVTLINDHGESSEWLVLSTDHQPSKEALKNAGNAARRDNVTVSWAVPLTGATGVGNLSAYFPIKSETTLTGRLNAPWKLSDDRINLIESKFNQEILEEVVPRLVVKARPYLIMNDEFGRYLDILPARGRESRSWADDVINKPIYEALREANSLPDYTGTLRSPRSLKLPPQEIMAPSTAKIKGEALKISRKLTTQWLELKPLSGDWVHPECISTDARRAKTERLMALNSEELHADMSEWVESLVDKASQNARRSAAAINFINFVYEWIPSPAVFNSLIESEVVLLETGIWVQPESSRCFIRNNPSERGAGFVDPQVIAYKGVTDSLNALGIRLYEDTGQLYEKLSKLKQTVRIDWEDFWAVLRTSSLDDIKRGFEDVLFGKQEELVRIMDGTGQFVLPEGQLIPGKLVQDLKQDAKYLTHFKFHRTDKEILELLGLREQPLRTISSKKPIWLKEYRKQVEATVGTDLGVPRFGWSQLDIGDSTSILTHLNNFPRLSETNRAILTKFILDNIFDAQIRVGTKTSKKVVRVIHPELWLIKNFGVIQTSLGLRPISQSFLVSEDFEQIGDIVPVASGFELSATIKQLINFHTTIEELSQEDYSKLVKIHVERNDEPAVGKTYSWWCNYFPDSTPKEMYVHFNDEWFSLPSSQIAVSSVSSIENSIEELGIPTLIVPEQVDSSSLSTHWGLMDASQVPIEYHLAPVEDESLLLLRFPSLQILGREDLDSIKFQLCSELSRSTKIPGRAQITKPAASGFDGETIFTTAATRREQLIDVLSLLEEDSSEEAIELHLSQIKRRENNKLREDIRKAKNDAERLFLIGGYEALISIIPAPSVEFIESTGKKLPKNSELAEICLKMFGPATLEKICGRLSEKHPLAPIPRSWTGSSETRKWVRGLGFSEEFAGKKGEPKTQITDFVEGPTHPGKFHDYQEKVSQKLRAMLRGEGQTRGLITLPTGAGKTRVSVQTIIESITADEIRNPDGTPFRGPILWLANSVELCEQALQTWEYLWRAFGKPRTRLALTRHDGDHNAEEEPDSVQVVFGTFHKTKNSTTDPNYKWLSKTPLVIIDEAHSALAKSYTEILHWTGRSGYQRDKLLLGLSATPYRGTSDSAETDRLMRRFDSNVLDEGVFGDDEPMLRLQRDKVLSEVSMEIIRNEGFIPLTDQEIEQFREKHFLPTAKAYQLGLDSERTQRIIESIKSKPEDWSILVFAASTENAETIATALTLDGIPSASINGKTPLKERTDILERFKSGDLRVLTNYNVLTQGFDAPKTRAVYITRPTTSEVRYLQMIGRGLRGPKNGGTESVHIVNILDNLQSFPESINYQQFTYLASNIKED